MSLISGSTIRKISIDAYNEIKIINTKGKNEDDQSKEELHSNLNEGDILELESDGEEIFFFYTILIL